VPKQFLTVKEVAKLLGVTPLTVRNWDKSGKLRAYRNPLNNYRVYKIEDVEKLLKTIEQTKEVALTAKSEVKKLKVEML